MAVSGTISTTSYDTARLIEHAFRRCRLPPQKITSEMLETAQTTLYLLLSSLPNRGEQLWAMDTVVLETPYSTPAISMPQGTVDVVSVLSRDYDEVGSTLSSSTSYSEATLDSEAPVSMVGVVFTTTGTYALSFAPYDGVLGASCLTVASASYTAGTTYWFNFDRVVTAPKIRVTETTGATLPVTSITVTTNCSDIPIAQVNREDYDNLPNKTFTGRPLQYWIDKQRDVPKLWIWPVANTEWSAKPIVVRRRRYIMDVGTLPQTIDVPQRWYDAITWQLAWRVAKETPEVDAGLIPDLKLDAADALAVAQGGESDRSSLKLMPNIRRYTR